MMRAIRHLCLLAIVLTGIGVTSGLTAGETAAVEALVIDDNDIELAVETEMLLDDRIEDRDIDVTATTGIVTLSGDTINLLSKRRAEDVALATRGVRGVVNRIDVTLLDPVPDATVKRSVETALLVDPAADSYEIDVSVRNGTVTLEGTVQSYQERQLCEQVALSVKGVRAIKNSIAIQYSQERPDSEMRAEIERRLESNVWVDDSLVEVAVKDAEVALSGKVGSAAERRRAYSDAWVLGVSSVNDDALEVDPLFNDTMQRKTRYTYRSDAEIKTAVEDAFLYDPRVLSVRPEVTVDKGVVTLRGTVEDLAAKNAAQKDAENVLGVAYVSNRLRVRPPKSPSDTVITKTVADALKRNPIVDRHEITPTTQNGTVYLSGTTSSPVEAAEAVRVASGVHGVIDVRNGLDVNYRPDYPPTRIGKTDVQIRREIKDQMWWNPFVDEDAVHVSVQDGVARLSGNVSSYNELRGAMEEAYEGGALGVVTEHLQVVRPGS